MLFSSAPPKTRTPPPPPFFQEAELTNGRWAMAAVAGILFTDLFGLGDWWTAGAKPTPLPLSTLVGIQTAVFAFLEAKRYEAFKKNGPGLSGAAGIAPFDPMGMDSPEMRVKEIKNARLAMLAFLGFASVAAVRGLVSVEKEGGKGRGGGGGAQQSRCCDRSRLTHDPFPHLSPPIFRGPSRPCACTWRTPTRTTSTPPPSPSSSPPRSSRCRLRPWSSRPARRSTPRRTSSTPRSRSEQREGEGRASFFERGERVTEKIKNQTKKKHHRFHTPLE